MKENKVGSASQQLYAQFFYRILKLKRDFNLSNVYIAFFSKTQFLTGGKYWEGFEESFFLSFNLKKEYCLMQGNSPMLAICGL